MVCRRVLSWMLLSILLLVSVRPSSLAQPNAFEYVIDPDLEPAVAELPGIGGGQERPVGAVLDPDGVQGDFVTDEVILHDPLVEDLAVFTETYGAEVIFGGTLPAGHVYLPPDKLRPGFSANDDYLLRVDLSTFDFNEGDFITRMESRGYDGLFVFSSQQAVELLALVLEAEETIPELSIALNPLMLPPPQPVDTSAQWERAAARPLGDAACSSADCVMGRTEEYTVTGGYANSFAFSWLNDADLKATRAYQYYDLLEYTPTSYPVLAMVDAGFAINDDFFPQNMPQYDFVTDQPSTDGNANTLPSGGKWHGTGTLGLAAARLNNRFGTAGTGGQVAFPYLFRPEGTLYGVAQAVRTAVYWGADVVNVSAAAPGASIFQWLALENASSMAANAGVIVLVTAGNNGNHGSKYYPCNTSGFLCVGGFDMSTKQAHANSNYGAKIAVWGPYNGLQTTPNPDSGGALTGFGGTCGASAYAAGVVTLMRAVSPTLDAQGAFNLLKSTATNPAGDAKLSNAGGVLNAYGAVKAAAESAGLSPNGDSYEPNDSAGAAASLPVGTATASIAPEDVDTFTFQTSDLVDLQLRVSYVDTSSPGNGLNARLDGSWGTTSGGTITLDQTLLTPGTHTLSIWGQYTDTINCYQTEFYTTASAIAPDKYDDQTPAGEARNDTLANRAVIPGTVQASTLTPMGQIVGLNFDVKHDVDFFEVTLAPAVDPQTGHTECITPGHPDGFTQGRVEISAWPDAWVPSTPGYNWPFQLTVYSTTGSVFTSTTGLRLSIECPHQHFPDGKLRFSIQAQDGRRNFYRSFIHYSRWDVYYDVPTWVWEQTEPPLLRVLPPWVGLIEQKFPRDWRVIGRWAAGDPPHPMPAEYGAFYWQGGDADVYLFTQGGHQMGMTLYNADQEVIGDAAVGGAAFPGDAFAVGGSTLAESAHIHVDDLDPGTYILEFEGDFGAVYSVSIGPPYLVYLPLALRDFE